MPEINIGDFYQPDHGAEWGPQHQFHASSARYPLQEGTRGGGKTIALLWEGIRTALVVPGSNNLLLRRILKSAEMGGIEDHFLKYVPKGIYRQYNGQKHTVRFHNSSNLFFGHIKSDTDLKQYQGPEYLYVGWDELTQFTYPQWAFIKGSNRCPVPLDIYGDKPRARMAGGTNPNGIGSGWVKALWIQHKLPAGIEDLTYDPNDYEVIHSTFADNPIYANDAEYIAGLSSLPANLRAAWLEGSWDVLAGQFFPNWDLERHVKAFTFQDWQPRWIGIDWGFNHASCILWFTQAEVIDSFGQKKTVVVCYRELVRRGINEQALAELIVKHSTDPVTNKVEPIANVYLSPERFNRINEEHTIADRMGDVLAGGGLPRPERANNDRVGGWRLVYTLLDTEGFCVSANCRDLIESIPQLMRDEKDLEDAASEGNELFLDVMEACIPAGVLVETARGSVPIEQVRVGDYALTRKGFRMVTWSGQTGIKEVLRYGNMAATGNHPVWIDGEFRRWDALEEASQLLCVKRLSLKDACFTAIRTRLMNLTVSISAMAKTFCTAPSIASSTDQFQMDMRFITRKGWATNPAISSPFPLLPTDTSIDSRLFARDAEQSSSGIARTRSFANVIVEDPFPADSAEHYSRPEAINDFVPMPVSQLGAGHRDLTMWQRIVSAVGRVSEAIGLTRFVFAPVSALAKQWAVSAENVYNLEVEGEHEYFAGGILVHNCRYGLMSYFNPRPTPKAVLDDIRIRAIPDNTAKYLEHLRLTAQRPSGDLFLNVPKRDVAWRR